MHGDPRNARDFLFFVLAIVSVFYGVKKSKVSLLAMFLIISGFFYTEMMNRAGFLYQFPMWCAGIICFVQLYQNPMDIKKLKILVGLLGTVSGIWGILNYFGIEPYHLILKQKIFYPKHWGLALGGDIIGFPQLGINPIHSMPYSGIHGPLFNHTLSSVYPAIALVLCGFSALSPIWILGLIVYNSTMSILAAIIGVLYFYLDSKDLMKWWVYLLGISVLLFLFGRGEFFSGQERLQVWRNIIDWAPVHGGGLGYFHDFYHLKFKNIQLFIQEHNEYLAAYTAFGLFGVFLSIIAVFLVLKQESSRQKAATVSFLFICAGSFPLHISSLAIIGILLYTLTIQGENYGLFSYEKN